MGFFSAFKKFFGQKEKPETSAASEEIAAEAGRKSEAVPETAPAPENVSEPTPDDMPEAAPEQESAAESGENATGEDVASRAERADAEIPAKPEETGADAEAPATLEKGGPETPENAEPEAESKAGSGNEEKPDATSAPEAASSATEQAAPEAADSQDSTPQAAAEADAREKDVKSGESAANAKEGGSGDALLLRLRQAEPRLSSWLDIALEGQDEINDEFWSRLRFFLNALEAPPAEIDAFIASFADWLRRMEYGRLDEFRSELQYRLALALDMEDEEDERNRLMRKLGESLAATREQLGRRLDALFAGRGELDETFWEEMEEMFIMADMGYEASLEIVERLKRRAAAEKVTAAADARRLLFDELEEIFRQRPRIRATAKPEVVLMMGVNGAGKTTTIGKLAHRAAMEGKKTLIVAADTFRAAAIEQLEVWAGRAGSAFYAKPAGSDPASVAWEAMDYAQKHDIDIVFVDTAGRLQTRVNLMEELGKIRRTLAKKLPGAPHRSMLVLDATTGQNALSQAKLFREAGGADEIALTKLDGTAKGGVAIAVAMREGMPITFIGIGEKMEDLRPFNGRDFARALLGDAA